MVCEIEVIPQQSEQLREPRPGDGGKGEQGLVRLMGGGQRVAQLRSLKDPSFGRGAHLRALTGLELRYGFSPCGSVRKRLCNPLRSLTKVRSG